MEFVKKYKLQIILGILYAIIILPMAFSMYNAVPASDDFSFGTHKVSDNLLLEAIGYSAWCWVHHSGRWLTFFFQKLIVPLNYTGHLGHGYGLYMICVFLVFFFLLKASLKTIFKKVLSVAGGWLDAIVFVTIAVLFTTYYYSETYNWFTGATSYALPLALLLLMISFLIRYEETKANKYYVGVILAGLIPANSEVFDVALGLLYLYFAFYIYGCDYRDKKQVMKKLLPLIIFIVDGISTVIAPGNYVRQGVYDVTPNLVSTIKQIIINSLTRVQDIIFDHPFTVFLFALLVVCGIVIGDSIGRLRIWELIVLVALMVAGIQFPYVHGKAMYVTYLDVRMQFLVDYTLLIGMSLFFVKIGGLIADKCEVTIDKRSAVTFTAMLVMYAYLGLIQNYAYLDVIQVDILKNHGLISASFSQWDGIISEIENGSGDVVIYRDSELTWSPYFLYMGLTDGEVFSADPDVLFDDRCIMPNEYYGVDSIQLIYED